VVKSPLLASLRIPTKEHVKQLFAALAHIHGRGYISRDVRPDNIMVSPDGKRAYLTDFGFAVKKGVKEKYSGAFKTASDRVSKLLQKDPTKGFEVTAADDLESLVKVCPLAEFVPPVHEPNYSPFTEFVPLVHGPKSGFQRRL